MSKFTRQKRSDGDVQPKSQSNAHQNRKRPMKSNITSTMRTRRSAVVAPGDVQGDDGDGDGSANEEHDDAIEDPDVSALPDAPSPSGGETGERLAGRYSKQQHEDAVGGADLASSASSDDVYDDIERISDEDEFGEPGLFDDSDDSNDELHAEEPGLINEFMELSEQHALARSLSLQNSEPLTDEFGFPINLSSDPFHGVDHSGGVFHNMANEAEIGMWGRPRENSDPNSSTQKRVRFEEVQVDDASASESEDPDDAYPDLLDAADVPGLKDRIARGLELDARIDPNDFNDAESCFDFDGDDERLAFQIDEESDSGEDMSSDDSDDDGDTTDEETQEEQIARMKERKQASAKAWASTEQHLPIRSAAPIPPSPNASQPTTPKGSSRGPRAGKFAADPTRATITTDSDGKNIKLQPPATPLEKDKAFWDRAKTANSSRDGSPGNSCLTRPASTTDSMPDRPFTTESTLGGMFQGNLEFLRNHDVAGIIDDGAADDVPPTFVHMQTSFISTTTMADSDTDLAEDINMQDFLDISDSGSDTEEQQSDVFSPATDSNWFDGPMDIGTPGRRGSDLMGHFDQYRGLVGSFRYNQNQAKHASSLAAHPAQRASTHEYNALQKGRRGAANVPMTPARKKRISQDITTNTAGVRKSLTSPFSTRRPRSRGNSLSGFAATNLYQTLAGNPFDPA